MKKIVILLLFSLICLKPYSQKIRFDKKTKKAYILGTVKLKERGDFAYMKALNFVNSSPANIEFEVNKEDDLNQQINVDVEVTVPNPDKEIEARFNFDIKIEGTNAKYKVTNMFVEIEGYEVPVENFVFQNFKFDQKTLKEKATVLNSIYSSILKITDDLKKQN